MNPNLEKGNELERAVSLIESQILRSNPNLINNPFTIEKKKTIIIDGVRHEIDLYIEIDLGSGYKSIFIFECKNWEGSVGKNEIIVFSEIVNAVQATRGYFVAREFGKYAIAQARKDQRIQLLTATNEIAELIHFPHFHCISSNLYNVQVIFDFGNSNQEAQYFEIDSVHLNGEQIEFNSFAQTLGKQVVNNKLNHEPTAHKPDGEYPYEAENTFIYKPAELMVNGESCEKVTVKVQFFLTIKTPRILSKFDIEKRARVIEYEGFTMPVGTINSKLIFFD